MVAAPPLSVSHQPFQEVMGLGDKKKRWGEMGVWVGRECGEREGCEGRFCYVF